MANLFVNITDTQQTKFVSIYICYRMLFHPAAVWHCVTLEQAHYLRLQEL